MAKKAYRVRNWSKYNKALTQRGSLTVWINKDTVKTWHEIELKQKVPGRPKVYSETAIEICAVIRKLFNLGLRQCEGFINSLFSLLKVALKAPCYSQLCRRSKELDSKLNHQVRGPIHVVIDGTGLKIYGEGEWKVRQQGYSKHRMWMKFHAGIDVESKEIVLMELTDNHIGENRLFEPLLDQYEEGYTLIGGDKGYDSFACHEAVGKRGARSAILIQRKAKVRKHKNGNENPLVRDEIVRRMQEIGRKGWKSYLRNNAP